MSSRNQKNLLSQVVLLGIFNECEDQEKKTFEELLNMFSEQNCVSLESSRPLKADKVYNEFIWYTYKTKEITDKFGRVEESEEILVFKEAITGDEEVDSTQVGFEIYLNDILDGIDGIEYDPLNNILRIYLGNGMIIKLY